MTDEATTETMSEHETAEDGTELYQPMYCPECDHGRLRVSDAIFAECDNCDAEPLRNEVGI